MAAKIKLKRLGKIRNPQYRVVVADARNSAMAEPSRKSGSTTPEGAAVAVQIDSERVQYWLGVGAQPTDAVTALLTGDR